jgi:two-component system, OmpR family, response regulator MprA
MRVLLLGSDPQTASVLSAHRVRALDADRPEPPDLVVVAARDVRVGVRSVHASLRWPGVPRIAVDTAGDPRTRLALLEAGADDCISRPFLDRELALRIRRWLAVADRRRRPPVAHGITVDTAAAKAWRDGRELGLTCTELALLVALLESAGVVATHRDLQQRVWGYIPHPNSNALRVYVSYLRHKLTAGGEPQILRTVRGVGYVLADARKSVLEPAPRRDRA